MKMTQIKVRSMTSNKGNPIANQFEIATPDGVYFQSYDSIIAFRPYNHVKYGVSIILDENTWDYSVTTGKYRNIFLGEGIAETRKSIADGDYKLADLNQFVLIALYLNWYKAT